MIKLDLLLTPKEIAALRLYIGRLTIGVMDSDEVATGFRKLFKELDRMHMENIRE